ncbi:MAG: cupin domain-containing protein [Deltaproteobacteria bacterium]|nr:cupin domain-containing protein [Deltaproteobacteria bacterium]
MSRSLALSVGLLAPVLASAAPSTLDQVVGATLRRNYDALHGCYRLALAQDRSRAGTLFVRVTLGAADTVTHARLDRDELKHAPTAACVLKWMRGWTLSGAAAAGAGPGTEVVVPIIYRAAPKQQSVWEADVEARALGAAGQVQLLLTRQNVGASLASLALLTLRSHLALPGAPQKLLYVLSGRGVLAAGTSRLPLGPGTALALRASLPVTLSPTRGELRCLVLFLPAGGEQALLPTKEVFPEIPAKGPAGRLLRPERIDRTTPLLLAEGKLKVTPLLQRKTQGHSRFYLGLLEAAAPSSVPEHSHFAEAEVLFVLSGKGEMGIEGTLTPVGPGQAIYIPAGASHSVRVESGPLKVVQVYVPGGPEQRFFQKADAR